MVGGLVQTQHWAQRQHRNVYCPRMRVQGPVHAHHISSHHPCSSYQQQPLGITKPRYLEQLENYLRKELLLLDLGTDSAQELRLQVRATK